MLAYNLFPRVALDRLCPLIPCRYDSLGIKKEDGILSYTLDQAAEDFVVRVRIAFSRQATASPLAEFRVLVRSEVITHAVVVINGL